MKRLMNAVETMLDESLDGFAAAHADIVELGAERKFIRRRALTRGKVALISGGGSGHEPLHAGFVGFGMLDAACPGQVFTSPTPDQMVAAIEAVDTGAGCPPGRLSYITPGGFRLPGRPDPGARSVRRRPGRARAPCPGPAPY
jgi:dihydroxyacetone kinase